MYVNIVGKNDWKSVVSGYEWTVGKIKIKPWLFPFTEAIFNCVASFKIHNQASV